MLWIMKLGILGRFGRSGDEFAQVLFNKIKSIQFVVALQLMIGLVFCNLIGSGRV